MTDTAMQSKGLSKPMRAALRELAKHHETERYGVVESFNYPTPGTLRALQKRGLIECDRFYACKDVRFTPAGRTALEKQEF